MDRRDALRLLGSAVTLPALLHASAGRLFALGWDDALAGGAGTDYQFQVLDPRQRETVATVADLILPETDTPGARAARVDEFIDIVLAEWCDDDYRVRFLAGLADLDARARAKGASDYLGAPPADRVAILDALDAELTAMRESARLRAQAPATAPAVAATPTSAPRVPSLQFYYMFRSLTLTGYFTSEPGFTLALRQRIIPGRLLGCVPLEVQ
jgi:hypothetical protein